MQTNTNFPNVFDVHPFTNKCACLFPAVFWHEPQKKKAKLNTNEFLLVLFIRLAVFNDFCLFAAVFIIFTWESLSLAGCRKNFND